MRKKAFIIFLMVGAVTMWIMSNHYFFSKYSGILKKKEIASTLWYTFTFRTHILCGLIAILSGPSQFIKRFRKKYILFHKIFGYTYTSAVLLSGMCGLIVAQYAMGGKIVSIGFSILSIIWIFTTLKSIIAIKKGNLYLHKQWSYLSYGLTFSAITQRIFLLIPLLTDIPFLNIYKISAWLPWLINLGVAQLLLNKSCYSKFF